LDTLHSLEVKAIYCFLKNLFDFFRQFQLIAGDAEDKVDVSTDTTGSGESGGAVPSGGRIRRLSPRERGMPAILSWGDATWTMASESRPIASTKYPAIVEELLKVQAQNELLAYYADPSNYVWKNTITEIIDGQEYIFINDYCNIIAYGFLERGNLSGALNVLAGSIWQVKGQIENRSIQSGHSKLQTNINCLKWLAQRIVVFIENDETESLQGVLGTSTSGSGSDSYSNRRTRGLPAGWFNRDIGTNGGSADEKDGIWTVSGVGFSTPTSDSLHFVYRIMKGDVVIIARVTDYDTEPNDMSKGGIMIRETLKPDSKCAMAVVTRPSAPNGPRIAAFGFRKDKRLEASGEGGVPSIPVRSISYWLKLERRRGMIRSWVSADGDTWDQYGSTEVPMGTSVYVGLCVSSHEENKVRSYTFNDVSYRGLGKASNPNPADGAELTDQPVPLSWTAGEGAESHRLYLSTDPNALYIADPNTERFDPNDTIYHLEDLSLDTNYFWRVDEVNESDLWIGDVWSFTFKGDEPPVPEPPVPEPPVVVTPVNKCVILSQLISLYSRCWASHLLELERKYEEEKKASAEGITFPQYVHKHPGIEHVGGVPKGGTFIAVYRKKRATEYSVEMPDLAGSNVYSPVELREYTNFVTIELAQVPTHYEDVKDGEIVADFCLPYLCCSETSSIQYIVFAELKIDIPDRICGRGGNCKRDPKYKIIFSPVNATLHHGDSKEAQELEKEDDTKHYYIEPGDGDEEWGVGRHRITISLPNKSTTYSFKIVKHPVPNYHSDGEPRRDGENGYERDFKADEINDDWTYVWYEKYSNGERHRVGDDSAYTHKYVQKNETFVLCLSVSNGECTEEYENRWIDNQNEAGFLRRMFGDHA